MSTPIQNCTWVDGMSPGDTRMTIDPEKLEEALAFADTEIAHARKHDYSAAEIKIAKAELLVEAARVTFATLPRYKEVEAEAWVVVDAQGRVGAFLYHNDADARDAAHERGHGAQAIRLTGTAKVRA